MRSRACSEIYDPWFVAQMQEIARFQVSLQEEGGGARGHHEAGRVDPAAGEADGIQ